MTAPSKRSFRSVRGLLLQQRNSKKVVIAFYAVSVVLFGGGAWCDLQPFMAESEKAREVLSADDLNRWNQQLSASNSHIDTLTATGVELFSPEWRATLLRVINDSESVESVLRTSAFASIWLARNPSDEEIKRAGVAMIDRGRHDLATAKRKIYEVHRRLSTAHDKSVILILRDGRLSSDDPFLRDAERLEQAEYRLLIPQAFEKNEQWLADHL